MLRSTVLVMIVVTAALSVGSALTAPRAWAESPLPIRVGYQTVADWLLFVAKDQKLFEKVGLAPTFVKFVAGAPMIEAGRNGSIDMASLGSVPFLVGLSQGVDWVMIGINSEGAYSEGLVAGKDSGIRTPADLRGKRIGFFRGSTAHYGLMMTLRQHGIRPDQVTLFHLSPGEQMAALVKTDIDATMVWEPWMQRMIHEANGRIVSTEGDIGIYTNVVGYDVRREWLRDNRETAERFLRALLMANDIVQRDPKVAIRVMAQEMEIREAWAEVIYQDAPPPRIHEWANPRYAYSLVKGSPLRRRLAYLAQFLWAEKLISKELDISEAFDASVISEALKTWKRGQ